MALQSSLILGNESLMGPGGRQYCSIYSPRNFRLLTTPEYILDAQTLLLDSGSGYRYLCLSERNEASPGMRD